MHGEHAVAPAASWYRPATHFSHSSAPGLATAEPGAHGVGSLAPICVYEPGGATPRHSEAPSAAEKRPAGQSSGIGEPSLQYVPAGQRVGTIVAAPHEKPAGHSPAHAGESCELGASEPYSPAHEHEERAR